MSNPHIRTELPGPNARALIARDAEVISPSYPRDYPFVMSHGRGTEVWDVDGNRFLDFAAGIAVCSTGHAHPQVVQAVQGAAEKFLHISSDYWHEQMVGLGERGHLLVPVIARDVQELAGCVLHRLHDARVRVARRADRDAGGEIEEAVAVHVPGFRALGVRDHEGVVARVGGRGDLRVALDHGAGLRSRQRHLDVRVLGCAGGAGNGVHSGSLTGSRCAAAVRDSRARSAASSGAVGAAWVSSVGSTVSGHPMAARASSAGTPG